MTGDAEPAQPPLKDLPISDRVTLALGDFEAHHPKPEAICVDHTEYPFPLPDGFQLKFPYLVIKAATEGESGSSKALITTPINPDDENMRYRLRRSDLLRRVLSESGDSAPQGLFDYFRFPKVLDVHNQTSPTKHVYVASMMEEYIETTSVGSVHLAEPGAFTTDDMRRTAQLFKFVQAAGQSFTVGEDFHHFRISVPFSDRQNNKWWIDYEKNPARLEIYRSVFGQEFVHQLGQLLKSSETAKLLPENAPRYLVLGNIIPIKLGKDASRKIVFRDIERTAYTQCRAFDYATFLATLITDLPRLEEFFRFSIEQNPDPMFLQHFRRSVVLDRLGNLPDLLRDRAAAEQAGDEQQYNYLDSAIVVMKNLAQSALYQTGMWV